MPTQPSNSRPAKILPIAVLLLAVGTAAAGAWWVFSPGSNSPNGSLGTLDLATANTMGFDVTTTASGELEARNQIEIRNKLETQTTIQDIIKEGVTVKAGDVLVRLNADEIQRQVDETQLTVEAAKADLANAQNAYEIQVSENESSLRKADLGVQIAELDLSKWLEGDVVSKRQANELALDKAKRELDRLKDKYEQAVRLKEKGFLSKDELDRDQLAYLEAVAALQTAELNKRTYEDFEHPKDKKTKESALDDAKAELRRTTARNENQLISRDADRVNKRQQLTLRQQRLDKLVEQHNAAVLKATTDGLVVYASSMDRGMRWGGDDGPLQIGRQVYPNQLLIILPDTSEMVASVRVPESLAGKVQPGLAATVKIDALGGRSLRGTILSVGVLAESGGWRDPNLREYTIKILLDPSAESAGIRPSMRCDAEVVLDRVENALAVPIQGIFSEGLVRYVNVASGGKFIRKPVKIGRRSDRFAELLTGVNAGDRVLVRKPTPGEIIDHPWDKAELAAVGLELTTDGKVMPMGGAKPPGGPGSKTAAAMPGMKPGAPKVAGTPAPGAPAVPTNDKPAPAIATPEPAKAPEAPATTKPEEGTTPPPATPATPAAAEPGTTPE